MFSGFPIFQDFLVAIDAVNCTTFEEKLKWALALWDNRRGRRAVGTYGLKRVLQLLDQVEEDGFMDGPSELELEKITFRKRLDRPKPVEERVDDILRVYPITADGCIAAEELEKVPEKMAYARE